MAFGLLAKAQLAVFKTPLVVYTAPASGAIINVLIANVQGIPLYFNLSIGVNEPAFPADYVAVNKIALPNISGQNTPFTIDKLVLSGSEKVILTLLPAENSDELYDTNSFALNIRVSGVDDTDLTAVRYSY